MKNVYHCLDWPTFRGVEDGSITIIPSLFLEDVQEGDTVTCSHLGSKVVKRVLKIIRRDVRDLTQNEVKAAGFNDVDTLEHVIKENYGNLVIKFIVLCQPVKRGILTNSTLSLNSYNPEYDEKPWRY